MASSSPRRRRPRSPSVLDAQTGVVVRTDPEAIGAYALFCYKRSWDKPIIYAQRGVPTAQYTRTLLRTQPEEANKRRVPGVAAFLPMPLLRKLAAQFTSRLLPDPSNVEAGHDPEDFLIRPSNQDVPLKLQFWAVKHPWVDTLMERLPAAAIKLTPIAGESECSVLMRLDSGAWENTLPFEAMAKFTISEMETLSDDFGFNAYEESEVYPLYHALLAMLQRVHMSTRECGTHWAAYFLFEETVTRMTAALESMFTEVSFGVIWRGTVAGRYPWLDEAESDDDEWERRLIKLLQSGYFSASMEDKVAQHDAFLGDGGLLIEFRGSSCRGIETNEALTGPWACYKHEKEILVAAGQHIRVVEPRKTNQIVSGFRDVTTITLALDYEPPEKEAVWDPDPDDPHFELNPVGSA